jgi:hypothetical protein
MDILFWRGRVSKAEFRREYIDAVRRRLPQLVCREADEDGQLSVVVSGLPDGNQLIHRLDNAYVEFRQDPRARSAILERWLDNLSCTIEPMKFERGRVLPLLKSSGALIAFHPDGLPEPGAPSELFHDVVNEDLVLFYIHHDRKGFHFLTREEIAALGLSDAEARSLAQINLRAHTPERTFLNFPAGWGVHVGGNFEATMLVDEELWNDARFADAQWVLAAAPDRNTLLASVDASVKGVWTLAFMAARLHRSESYPISPKLFVRREGRFEHLDPPVEDHAHPIPRLDTIDVSASTAKFECFSIVIASPLGGDPRSVYRLFRKLESYLQELGCDGTPAKQAVPENERHRIYIHIHPESDPEIIDLVRSLGDYISQRGGLFQFRLTGSTETIE